MRILVSGATGFVGASLCARLKADSHSLVGLSRDADSARRRVPELERAFTWRPRQEPAPREAFDGVDAVIHLCGEPIVGRWTARKKEEILSSRAAGTRNLVRAIERLDRRPKTLISASAIGYYGDRGEEELSEDSGPGTDFVAETCLAWEREARAAEALGVRTVILRIGIVLARGGGALGAMLLPARLGLGGPLGSGRQWWSWIDRDDLIELALFLLDEETLAGAVNAAAPNPARQAEFARALGRVLHRPAFLPAPAAAVRLAAGGFAAELLASKRVLPQAAERAGFRFAYPDLEASLRHALG